MIHPGGANGDRVVSKGRRDRHDGGPHARSGGAHATRGRLGLDGTRLVPVAGGTVRGRNRIGFAGSAVATVVIDGRGDLTHDPYLTLHGVIEPDDPEGLEDSVIDAIMDAVEDLPGKARRDDEAVADAARKALRRTVHKAIGKRPVSEIHVVRV